MRLIDYEIVSMMIDTQEVSKDNQDSIKNSNRNNFWRGEGAYATIIVQFLPTTVSQISVALKTSAKVQISSSGDFHQDLIAQKDISVNPDRNFVNCLFKDTELGQITKNKVVSVTIDIEKLEKTDKFLMVNWIMLYTNCLLYTSDAADE